MTIKDEIKAYNESHKRWKCGCNCLNCDLPYCISDSVERQCHEPKPIVMIYGDARVRFASIKEAARVLEISPSHILYALKKKSTIKKYGVRFEYEQKKI